MRGQILDLHVDVYRNENPNFKGTLVEVDA